jgi:hypothetical protein
MPAHNMHCKKKKKKAAIVAVSCKCDLRTDPSTGPTDLSTKKHKKDNRSFLFTFVLQGDFATRLGKKKSFINIFSSNLAYTFVSLLKKDIAAILLVKNGK